MVSHSEYTIYHLLYFRLLPRHPEDAVIGVGAAVAAEAATAATTTNTAAPAALAAHGVTLERGAQLRRPLTAGIAPVAAPLELACSGLGLGLEIGLG